MSAYSIPLKQKDSTNFGLSDWELEVIDLFLNAANSVGLPKSFGQIYGLLFCRDQPLSMDEIIRLLAISKGSVSQGLRALRQLGAVSSVYTGGDRKEHFIAEIRLRKLVSGFLKKQADPHMEKGVFRLESIRELLGKEKDGDSLKRGERREKILSSWHRQMSRLLPWVKMIAGQGDRLIQNNKSE
jgi:DNA-binding transcriptional regulator GbsR (MarR family)